MNSSKLYVGNLSYSVNQDKLGELFAAHGEVKSVTVIAGKGFGFVEMSSPQEAEAAKNALDGTALEGRNLKIDEARPPREKGFGGGGGFRHGGGGRNFRQRY